MDKISLHNLIAHFNDGSDTTSSDSSMEEEYPNFFLDSESSDSSTDEYTPRRKLNRIENYLETVAKYDEIEFKEHFRLNQSLIDQLEKDKVLPTHGFGREKITSTKGMYMTIWYLANTETFRQIADRFNVTKSSAHRTISRIINYFVKQAPKYIYWPNETTKIKSRENWESLHGIYGIVGAIDGSHIPIKKPATKYSHSYLNRKGQYSILLQGVCNDKKKFIDVFVGEAGSIHDSRLLKKSSLYKKCINGFLGNDFLPGDSAYPCMEWLVSPFNDNGFLSREQKTFNYRHSSTRILIENSFGLLKGRFRRLKMFENNNITFIVKCVFAAIVLHNICIDFDDKIDPDIEECREEEYDEAELRNLNGIHPNYMRRNEIFNRMFN